MTYQIISDSTCDLSPEQVAAYNIKMMPLYVHLGDRDYRDGVDIQPDDIYAHVAAGGGLGNLIDRLFRTGVVDFIACNLFDFPVFNVGDICVCCGVCIAAIGIWMGMRKRT